MRVFLILWIFVSGFLISYSQNPAVLFYEPITKDSAVLFFNERYHLVSKNCATYKRYTRLDADANFHGCFTDFTIDSVLLGKGCYDHGKKHGNFEFYYPNGNIKSSGTYEKNKPVGKWIFYHDNGAEERIVEISKNKLTLQKMSDKNGKMTVENGNGEFNGMVQTNSSATDYIIAKGTIKNGKPDGKWKSYFAKSKMQYCEEFYENGVFVKGKFPIAEVNKEYKDVPLLDNFFLSNYCEELEYFIREHCAEQQKNNIQNYNVNIDALKYDIGSKISRIIQDDISRGKTQSYDFGEKLFSIQFQIDKEGKPYNLTHISAWGHQFSSAIKSALVNNSTFPPINDVMYLHLKMNFSGGFTYSYSFSITKERDSN